MYIFSGKVEFVELYHVAYVFLKKLSRNVVFLRVCVCVCMCLCVSCYNSKGFTFGVRFLVDEGSSPGGRYFMQKMLMIIMMMMGTKLY